MSQRVAPRAPRTGQSPATFTRLLVSEWTKLRTVRSTVWTLLLLTVVAVGFAVLIPAVVAHEWNTYHPADRASILDDPLGVIFGVGILFGQLTICVLGVLVISSEYATGMIRASLLAAPKRIPMLLAKALVFAIVLLVVGEAISFLCFFVGSGILHDHVPIHLSDPGILRAVVGVGLYLTVLGLFSLTIGAIVRNTAAAISGVIAFVLVLAPIAQLIPGAAGKYIHAYLPSEAGKLIGQTNLDSDSVLSPWQGFAVFCAWTAGLLIVAAILLRRRDA